MSGSSLSYCSTTELINSTRDGLPLSLTLCYISCFALIRLQHLVTSVRLPVAKLKRRRNHHVTQKWEEINAPQHFPTAVTSYLLTPLKVWIHIIFQQENKTTTTNQKQELNSHINSSLKEVPGSSCLCSSRARDPSKRAALRMSPTAGIKICFYASFGHQLAGSEGHNHNLDGFFWNIISFREKLPHAILCVSLWGVFHQKEENKAQISMGRWPKTHGSCCCLEIWTSCYRLPILYPGLSESFMK